MHAVRFHGGGRASYGSRWVRTARLEQEERIGVPLGVKSEWPVLAGVVNTPKPCCGLELHHSPPWLPVQSATCTAGLGWATWRWARRPSGWA